MGIVFDTVRFAWQACRLNGVAFLEPERLLQLQHQRFRAMLRHAVTHSPFYQAKYHGIDIERCQLQDLPITDKNELMAHFDDVVTDRRIRRDDLERFMADPDNVPRKYLDRYPVIHTSGSQGQPVLIVQDPFVLELMFALQMTRGNVHDRAGPVAAVKRLLQPSRLAVISMKHGFYPQGVVWTHVPRPVGYFLKILRLSPTDADLVERLNEFRPNVLAAYASVLELLALQGNLRLAPELRQVVSNSETLSARSRRHFERSFHAPVIDNYSMGECGFLTTGCHTHPGCHVHADWAIMEVVDDEYRPVPAGVTGSKILLTNLANRVQPFLRYEITDQVTMATTPCGCRNGRLPRIERIDGRASDFFWVSVGGRERQLLSHVFKNAFEFVNEIREWQVIQESRNSLRIRLEMLPGAPLPEPKVRHYLQEQLDLFHLNGELEFTFEETHRIDPDAGTGKIRRVVSQAAPAVLV
jgi:phenylacetate-coenzyme A ligase PaaK-like adenylate-forming protein